MSSIPITPRRAGGRPTRFRRPRQPPETVAATGLSPEFIVDLLLKTLYVQGARTGQHLTDTVRLPFDFVDDQLLSLQQRRLVEVRATSGPSRGGYIFDLTSAGRDRAREALASSQYVGPAPVPLDQYRTWVEKQTIRNVHVTKEVIRDGFQRHGALRGHSRHARSRHQLGQVAVPVRRAGQRQDDDRRDDLADARWRTSTCRTPWRSKARSWWSTTRSTTGRGSEEDEEKPSLELVADDPAWLTKTPGYDRRYTLVRRPVVLTGGELTLEQLDLQYDRYTKMYQAPFQVKANGGVLILDDFGRQRVPPKDLLNRWIVPLEKRIDFLTLHTGGKFPVPFDTLLIISTNLEPSQLVEEAFLRRIHYKIMIEGPDPEQFADIFERNCKERAIAYDHAIVRYIYEDWYGRHSIIPRGCHPRDILDHVVDIARFHQVHPEATVDMVDRACRSYFLDDSRTS